eukprot:g5252.t1
MDLGEDYDEFGNYIGADLSDSTSSDSDSNEVIPSSIVPPSNSDPGYDHGDNNDQLAVLDSVSRKSLPSSSKSQIVLHEDKQYYPDAEDVYKDAEVRVEGEDSQPITEPIIKPIKEKSVSILENEVPQTKYTTEFMTTLMEKPALIRNVAVIGHLHHGKTSLIDQLIEQTHVQPWSLHSERKYTDSLKSEQERGLSIKSSPVSLVLPNLRGKHYLLNLIDTPGHVNFSAEVTAAMRPADGCLLVVDAVEGVMLQTERLIRHSCQAGLSLVLVISKMDRLITELKLPPEDAYYKLVHIIAEVNSLLKVYSTASSTTRRVSPTLGNVCFASGKNRWSFSLLSFAEHYSKWYGGVDAAAFARRLWGDFYFDHATRRFSKNGKGLSGKKRTFVEFILEPIYKLHSQILGEDEGTLKETLKVLHIKLKQKEFSLDPEPLLKLIMSKFFGQSEKRSAGLVEMITKHIPSALAGTPEKVVNTYKGAQSSLLANAMKLCDPTGPLMVNIVKLFPSNDGQTFGAFGRILSGTLGPGQTIQILGEEYSEEDEEDCTKGTIKSVAVMQGRYYIYVSRAVAGNLVMLEGIDKTLVNTATLCTSDSVDDALRLLEAKQKDESSTTLLETRNSRIAAFRPLQFDTKSVVKLAVEPLEPLDLPKMLDGLRKINKSYPLVQTRVEESGEHVIYCTGELHADCVMYDLRHTFSEVEVKIADPCVAFAETVAETSSISCSTETPNKFNQITLIAEPLDEGLAEDLEDRVVDPKWNQRRLGDFFQKEYGWDLLAARNVWGFGPSSIDGTNVLIDDTLPSEVDKALLLNVKESVVQGFRWACREGPLCEEPIRNVKFKILNADVARDTMLRSGAQIIPTSRRAAYSSFLLAAPRMMEPVYFLEVLVPSDAVEAVYKILQRRRGYVDSDAPKPGTPFYVVYAYIPVIESFGFETDLRVYTQGQAFCLQVFDHWALVPGNPMDENIVLRPLERCERNELAREFMIKTRRRKGLSESLSVEKYFDDPSVVEEARKSQLIHETEFSRFELEERQQETNFLT